MKNKIFFFIISAILLYGCATKKSISKVKEVVKRDSIYILKDRYITKQVNDTITIKEVCDTITGNLKDFERVIKTNDVKVSIKSLNGNIQASVNIDSIVNSKITEFKQNYKTEKEYINKEIIRYKTPFWMWLVIILEGLIIFLLIRLK